MKPIDLSERIASTYFWLRIGMGVISLAFSPLLVIGGYVAGRGSVYGSMSAYYHADSGLMRDWFVGILFAIGIMLFLYEGFTRVEDTVLNIAGVLALGIALFPMSWPEKAPYTYQGINFPLLGLSIHGTCAIIFFLCIGYVCVFHGDDTLGLLKQKHGAQAYEKYRRTYKWLGFGMFFLPVLAALLSQVIGAKGYYLALGVEWAGVWVFAIYWLVKSREIHWTQADKKAAKGELKVVRDDTKAIKGKGAIMKQQSAPADDVISTDVISTQDQVLGKVSIEEK